jgi:hypothetical protein
MTGQVVLQNAGHVRDEAPLSPIERSLVAALVSAIVKELRATQPEPMRQPAA